MQWTGHLPVRVDAILRRLAAEYRQIEMGVRRLQRIERPLDELDAGRTRAIGLRALEPHAEPMTARLGPHTEHVRPVGRASRVASRHRPDESDEPRAVPCADENAATLDGRD